jgi:hypothetical protein
VLAQILQDGARKFVFTDFQRPLSILHGGRLSAQIDHIAGSLEVSEVTSDMKWSVLVDVLLGESFHSDLTDFALEVSDNLTEFFGIQEVFKFSDQVVSLSGFERRFAKGVVKPCNVEVIFEEGFIMRLRLDVDVK